MADDWMFHNSPKPPPRQPKPGELLLTFEHGQDVYRAELRDFQPHGVEAQILQNGVLLAGCRFTVRALAVRCGRSERHRTHRQRCDGDRKDRLQLWTTENVRMAVSTGIRTFMKLLTSFVIASSLFVAPVAQSLRERAKQEGGSATTTMGFEFDVVGIPELLSQSDVVLYGRVVDVKPHLSPDESYVVTDYEIAPLRAMKQTRLVTTARPGQTTQILVSRPGGVLIEGGYRLSTSATSYPESEALKLGEEAVLFLKYRADTKAFSFTGGPFGVFRVFDGRVQAMTHEAAQRRGDKPVPVTAFLNDLQKSVK